MIDGIGCFTNEFIQIIVRFNYGAGPAFRAAKGIECRLGMNLTNMAYAGAQLNEIFFLGQIVGKNF